jgi:hypothetical protein
MTNNENQSITIQELKNTSIKVRKCKVLSKVDINSELHKHVGEIFHHRLLKFLNTIIKTGQI